MHWIQHPRKKKKKKRTPPTNKAICQKPTKEKDGKTKTNTIAVVRALRAMGLLRIAVLELALPSTSTWKKGQDSIFMALQRWNEKNTIKRRKTGSGFCRNCLLGYETHRFLRCWVEQRDIWNEGKNHGWEENACVLRPSKIASFSSSLAEIEDRERLESTLLLLWPSKTAKTSYSAWILCCNWSGICRISLSKPGNENAREWSNLHRWNGGPCSMIALRWLLLLTIWVTESRE